jgi:lipoyl(octanoyl) transferase
MALIITSYDLGLKEYKEAWDYQEKVHADVLNLRENPEKIEKGGVLLFCEHPHVYTIGKSGQRNNLLVDASFLKKINATFYESNRGGDITYHGPGQVVGYPIFDLVKLKLGVKKYIFLIEESIIRTLKEYGISATRLNKATGVWLDTGSSESHKICAIGVRVSKAVTMHGFALNVNTDLSYFSYINPCGFQDKGVTSMQKELGSPVDLSKVKNCLKKNIALVFDQMVE